MAEFHDFFISQEFQEDASEIGWSSGSIEASVKVLEAEDWGELKRNLGQQREEHDVLGFRGGDHELNRKVFSDPRMDVVLHPGKGRKDSGMNHVDAEKAAENDIAIGFSLKEVPEDQKRQSHKLNEWRKNLKLCEKYNVHYIITTEAENFSELRAPRDIGSIIDSLGYNGRRAVSYSPERIIEKNMKAKDDSQVRPGHEVLDE
jgi:ribonuclease P/MRP protein subunit RPP1